MAAKATIIDARRSTIVGSAKQIRDLLDLIGGSLASIVDLRESNFVVTEKPVSHAQIVKALQMVPK